MEGGIQDDVELWRRGGRTKFGFLLDNTSSTRHGQPRQNATRRVSQAASPKSSNGCRCNQRQCSDLVMMQQVVVAAAAASTQAACRPWANADVYGPARLNHNHNHNQPAASRINAKSSCQLDVSSHFKPPRGGCSPKDSRRQASDQSSDVSCSPFCPIEHQSNEPVPSKVPCHTSQKASPASRYAYFFFWPCSCSFSTFLTIFCSSMRKARTIRSRTQPPHLEPP